MTEVFAVMHGWSLCGGGCGVAEDAHPSPAQIAVHNAMQDARLAAGTVGDGVFEHDGTVGTFLHGGCGRAHFPWEPCP